MSMTLNPMASALQQMQTMAGQAAGGAIGGLLGGGPAGALAAAGGDFASALKASLDKVSNAQQSSLSEAHAFEVGAPNTSLNDVMVDMQKANIGFQEAVQVRNKLVSAYNTVMQMSV